MNNVASDTPVILQVLPSLKSGGVERGTIEVARAIAGRGWKPLVASSGGPMAAQLKSIGAEHITLPLASKNPLVIWKNSKALARIIRKHGITIVHARSRAPAWSAWLAARQTGCHFMTTFHGVYSIQNKLKRRYNAIMTRGERIIAISHFIAEHIKQEYGVGEERVRIIHRGVDLKLFHNGSHSTQRMIDLAKQWHLPDDMPVILFPGRLTRWKGQDIFIKALQQIPHRHFFAVILGDDKGHPEYREELEKLVMELGLGGNVRMAPHTPYMTEAYRLSKIVVATSLRPEAFGRIMIEAQAMGRPVITTNHGGARETVKPNVSGWLVAPNDVQGLAAVITHALSLDEAELRWMGDQAKENAAEFSHEVMCSKTLSVYEELLPAAAAEVEVKPAVEASA